MRGTEFADLRAFAEVADRRSFARAAEHLRVAPSTLSQAIPSLENRLGVVLLNRTTRRVSLTSADRLLSRFAPAMREMEAAVLDAHEGRTQPHGVVRLHAPRPAYARHVAPVLGLLRNELPDVVLDGGSVIRRTLARPPPRSRSPLFSRHPNRNKDDPAAATTGRRHRTASRREPMPRIGSAALSHARRDPAAYRTIAHIPW